MNSEIDPESKPQPNSLSRATSDLNNALQIISVTASLIDNAWQGSDRSEEYLAMLRASVLRAEHVAAEFVRQTGGPGERVVMNPQLVRAGKRPSAPLKSAEQRILLVDDDPVALALVKRILTDAGYPVVAAHSGFECLDVFRSSAHTYDLVILDMNMPLLTGEETFHRLREIRPDMPVVLCAGFIEQEKLTRLMGSGLAGLLRKPLAPDEILDHVRATLESLKYSHANADPAGISTTV